MSRQFLTQYRNQPIPVPQVEQNVDLLRSVLLNQIKAIPIGTCPLEELKLIYDKNDENDVAEIREILSKRLTYPSSEIAQVHMKANKLGALDLKYEDDADSLKFKVTENANFCPCCGFIQQQNYLPMSTQINKINHIGVSTYLYFLTIKHLILLLLIMLIIISIYAIISNIISSIHYKNTLHNSNIQIQQNKQSYYGFLILSLGSKLINKTLQDQQSFLIQCWLGVAVVLIWGIGFGLIKHRQKKISSSIDIESKTASDYTILIKNYPKHLKLQQLQTQLNEYKNKLNSIKNQSLTKITIQKINLVTPFYLDQNNFNDTQINQINLSYTRYVQQFIAMIKQRLSYPIFQQTKNIRQNIYTQFQTLRQQKIQIYHQFAQKIKKQLQRQYNQEIVPAFVTFSSTYNAKLLINIHDNDHWLFTKLTSVNQDNFFYFKSNQNDQRISAQIRSAPEPQDIIWTNMGQKSWSLFKKKIKTYTVTIIVLAASFAAIYGLSKVQTDYVKHNHGISTSYISGLISLSISIINIIIQQILRLLTKLQRNPTYIHQQSSLGIKAVCALLINSILIPILVNKFFKGNLYGVNGLAHDVFYLGITNSMLSPFLKMFDIYYYYTRLMKWYRDKPVNKLTQNQNQLNAVWQKMQFQIGYEYIYIVNLFLFTCFFCSLQPIIVLFAMIGLASMYWSQKYSLFNRCKRPAPGTTYINTTMYQLIYLGPVFYVLGSFCWSNFFVVDFIGMVPNIVALVLAIIIFIIPYSKLVQILFDDIYQQQELFQKNRIFLPSEYDRLNPATYAEGINDYLSYLAQYKKSMDKKSSQQLHSLQSKFVRQYGRGSYKNQPILPTLANYLNMNRSRNYNQNQILLQNVLGIHQNLPNPLLIGNTVLYHQNNNPFNVIVQNWNLTNKQNTRSESKSGCQNFQKYHPKHPFKMIQSHIYHHTQQPKESEGVKINGNTELQNFNTNNNSNNNHNGINFLFNGLLNQGNNENNVIENSRPQTITYGKQQIPLNVPINVFTGLLNLPQNQRQSRNR